MSASCFSSASSLLFFFFFNEGYLFIFVLVLVVLGLFDAVHRFFIAGHGLSLVSVSEGYFSGTEPASLCGGSCCCGAWAPECRSSGCGPQA